MLKPWYVHWSNWKHVFIYESLFPVLLVKFLRKKPIKIWSLILKFLKQFKVGYFSYFFHYLNAGIVQQVHQLIKAYLIHFCLKPGFTLLKSTVSSNLEHNLFKNVSEEQIALYWQTQIQVIEYGLNDAIQIKKLYW